jgi:DNA-binding CsgD family transcriptional regulator
MVLVADETGYRFRHALLREAVHDDLLPGQHARLHAHFAAILEERPELITGTGSAGTAASEIAHHWSAAHEVNKAFDWSIKAASSGTAAFHETLQMYERALELWDQVTNPQLVAGDHAFVLEQAARAATDAGETERGLALIGASLAETDPDSGLEPCIDRLILKSRLLSGLLRPGAVEAASDAVALLPEDSAPDFRARAFNQLATATMLAGAKEDSVVAAGQGIEAAIAAGSAALESDARNTLGSSLVALGREDEGLAELMRAGRLAGGNTRTMLRYAINYSDALMLSGRYRQATSEALAGVDVARSLGLERSFGAMLAGNAAEPLLALGEWDRAVTMAERALELDPPAYHYVHLRLLMAWVAVWRNDLDKAEAILNEFRHLVGADQPAPQYSSFAIRVDADYALAIGDHGRAWADLELYLDHEELYQASAIYPVLAAGATAARLLDSADRTDRRIRLVREALAAAKPVGVRPGWQPVIEAGLEDTADGWRRAWKLLSDDGAPAHLVPYAGLRLAQHLVVSRDRAEAREVLAAATALASRIGADLLISRLAALAQRSGLADVEVRPGANPLAGLTPREVEVLQLIAEGKSNGEIGIALFISTKTASVHVSNILAKLGVSSRGEAAALAHRRGLLSTV